MQTKTTMNYPYTPIKMTKTKKGDNNNCFKKYGPIRAFIHYIVSYKIKHILSYKIVSYKIKQQSHS